METTTTNTENAQQLETKWFVLRVVSGKERKVKEYLDKEISRGGWSERKFIKYRMAKKLCGNVIIIRDTL